MKATLCLLLVLVASFWTNALTTESGVTPVQKCLELMQTLLEDVKNEKHEEQVEFAAFKQFCDDTTKSKKSAIEEADTEMAELKSDIQKSSTDSALLSRGIAGHDENIAIWGGDIKANSRIRAGEKALFDKAYTDSSDSIDALERAIEVLKEQDKDTPQADSFLQLRAALDRGGMPQDAQHMINALISQGLLQESAPEANAYEFQSFGVLQMLEKLLNKFVDERSKLMSTEVDSRHKYDMVVLELKQQIEQASQDRDDQESMRAKKLEEKAEAEDDYKETSAARKADKKFVDDLTASCEQKLSDFKARQELRAGEILAIKKAIQIISSPEVAGHAKKHLPSLLETRGTVLAQVRVDVRNPMQEEVSKFLQDKATQLGSNVLSALAVRVAGDSFAKVKRLIQELIVKLKEAAAEEASHKEWCDEQLSTNAKTRKKKTDQVEVLNADIDSLEASIAKLADDLAELNAAVAELDAAMKKSTAIRAVEKKKNAATVKDAKISQKAVSKAIAILKEFYGKAATRMKASGAPYKGMQGKKDGVIGMMEVVLSDFARLESETSASDAAAQAEYEKFLADSKADKTAKAKDIDSKTAKKQEAKRTLVSKKGDLEDTQSALNAALAFFEKLKPDCLIDIRASYDERVEQRNQEIQSLREALQILNGEAIA